MSRYDYHQAAALYRADTPFYALIMAAMLRADTTNMARLRAAFPDTYNELEARYNAPGGALPTDGTERTIIRTMEPNELANLAGEHQGGTPR